MGWAIRVPLTGPTDAVAGGGRRPGTATPLRRWGRRRRPTPRSGGRTPATTSGPAGAATSASDSLPAPPTAHRHPTDQGGGAQPQRRAQRSPRSGPWRVARWRWHRVSWSGRGSFPHPAVAPLPPLVVDDALGWRPSPRLGTPGLAGLLGWCGTGPPAPPAAGGSPAAGWQRDRGWSRLRVVRKHQAAAGVAIALALAGSGCGDSVERVAQNPNSSSASTTATAAPTCLTTSDLFRNELLRVPEARVAVRTALGGEPAWFVSTPEGATWLSYRDPTVDDASGLVVPLNDAARAASDFGTAAAEGAPVFQGVEDSDAGASASRACAAGGTAPPR